MGAVNNKTKSTFTLKEVEFNKETRLTKLLFEEKYQYRKIERYQTVNYQKYRVYGPWLTKIKDIVKKIKLTNKELERLPLNNDELIASNDYAIIESIIELADDSLTPSWFAIRNLDKKFNDIKNDITNNYEKIILHFKRKLLDINNNRCKIEENIVSKEKAILYNDKLLHKLEIKYKKCISKPNIFAAIITLGLSLIKHSKCNIRNIQNRQKELSNNNLNIQNEIDNESKNLEAVMSKFDMINKEIDKQRSLLQDEINAANEHYENEKLKIKPLINNIMEHSDFTPLKILNGIEYKKIIGCYIIHNKENDKYYVGQSKDSSLLSTINS